MKKKKYKHIMKEEENKGAQTIHHHVAKFSLKTWVIWLITILLSDMEQQNPILQQNCNEFSDSNILRATHTKKYKPRWKKQNGYPMRGCLAVSQISHCRSE